VNSMTNFNPFAYNFFEGQNDSIKDLVNNKRFLNNRAMTKISAMDQKSTDIEILTREGDRVTLSTDSLSKMFNFTYNEQGYMNGEMTASSIEAFGVYSIQEVALSVEGDLNEEEMADIMSILGKIENLASDFFAGELDEAVAKALQFGDMGTVVAVEANLQYVYSASAEESFMVTGPSTSSELQGKVPADGKLITAVSIKGFLEKMIEALKESKVEENKLAKALPENIEKIFEKSIEDDDNYGLKNKLAKHIESELLERPSDKSESEDLNDIEDIIEQEEEDLDSDHIEENRVA
jgi:hypothetical protein